MQQLYHDDIFIKCGLDISDFKFVGCRGGKYEYHGPCWVAGCGGVDRMTVKIGQFDYTDIGLYICRVCSSSGVLDKLMVDPIDPATLEDLKKIAEKKREEERKVILAHRKKMMDWMNGGGLVEKLHMRLMKEPFHLKALAKDGITKKVVKKWKIGFNPEFRYTVNGETYEKPAIAFPIPSLDNKHYANIRMRIIGNETDKYRPFASKMGIQFMLCAYPNDNVIYIVEGEKKAIVLHEYGFSTAGLFGVNSFKDEWAYWFKRKFDKVYVLFDGNEHEGIANAARRIAKLTKGTVIWPQGKPDDELIKMTVPQFLRTIQKNGK